MREAALFISSRSSSVPETAFGSVVGALSRAYRAWTGRRKLMQISALDDHILCDIGLTREEIDWAWTVPWAADPTVELERRARRGRPPGWRSAG